VLGCSECDEFGLESQARHERYSNGSLVTQISGVLQAGKLFPAASVRDSAERAVDGMPRETTTIDMRSRLPGPSLRGGTLWFVGVLLKWNEG